LNSVRWNLFSNSVLRLEDSFKRLNGLGIACINDSLRGEGHGGKGTVVLMVAITLLGDLSVSAGGGDAITRALNDTRYMCGCTIITYCGALRVFLFLFLE